MEINLATFCLNLFESMEMGAKEKNLAIRCLPGDDTFDRSITIRRLCEFSIRSCALGADNPL